MPAYNDLRVIIHWFIDVHPVMCVYQDILTLEWLWGLQVAAVMNVKLVYCMR